MVVKYILPINKWLHSNELLRILYKNLKNLYKRRLHSNGDLNPYIYSPFQCNQKKKY